MQLMICSMYLLLNVILVFMFTSGVLSCGQKSTKEDNGQTGLANIHLQGTIRVSGAWALYPMMVRWGEEFGKVHPKVRVDISAGGAGKGVADALAGLVNVGMVSREITQEEVKQGAFYVPVVKDAVFPMMSDENPVFQKGLSAKGMKKQTLIDL